MKKKKIFGFILSLIMVLGVYTFAFADQNYTVKNGDTLSKIANSFGITYQEIAETNNIKNVNLINVGQVLIIPQKEKKVAETPVEPKKEEKIIEPKKEEKIITNYDAIKGTEITIATTTSTNDTGLLDTLVPAFDKKYGTKTKWVSVGSGEAMEMGKRGDADVLLVHSRAAEDDFVSQGFGVDRKDVMYNYFYIVGPKTDGAKIKGEKLAKDAFEKIFKTSSIFLSRADKSGTHTKELNIWKLADLSPTGKNEKWYKEVGAGMLDTLNMAEEMGGYTLVDSGTWGSVQDKLTSLEIMVQGDKTLFNPYGVITVNPVKYPNLNSVGAKAFTDFITSEEGQNIIKNYTKNGQNLFIPDAK